MMLNHYGCCVDTIECHTTSHIYVLIGVVYFLPNGDGAYTVVHIINCLDKIIQKHSNMEIILCVDFNKLNVNDQG